MTTIRLPANLPGPQLRQVAAELAAAARAAGMAADEAERAAADQRARAGRVRAAIAARRTASQARRAELHRIIIQEASAAGIAARAGVCVRTVERARARLLLRIGAAPPED
jgi:FixJ family two-component response regulator